MPARYSTTAGIQDRTGVAIANLAKQLRPLRTSTIAINGATRTFPLEIPRAQGEILTRLGIKRDCGFKGVSGLTR